MRTKAVEIIQSHIQRYCDEFDNITFDETLDLIDDGILDSMEFLELIMDLEQCFSKKIVSKLIEFDNPGLVKHILNATVS